MGSEVTPSLIYLGSHRIRYTMGGRVKMFGLLSTFNESLINSQKQEELKFKHNIATWT